MKDMNKKEVIKLLDAGVICDSSWVSHAQVIPKKGRMTMVPNEKMISSQQGQSLDRGCVSATRS